MISQFQVIGILKNELPKITGQQICQEIPRAFSSIHAAIYSLSDFTRINLELKHFQKVRKCFVLAEKIYLQGDIMVQLLIEKVFIDSLVLAKNAKTTNHLACLIPPALQKIYLKHLDPQTPPSQI